MLRDMDQGGSVVPWRGDKEEGFFLGSEGSLVACPVSEADYSFPNIRSKEESSLIPAETHLF
jgi:hypothetical protein